MENPKTEYTKLATPPACVADFCLIPVSVTRYELGGEAELRKWANGVQIGTASASVSNEVAEVQRLMIASGLSYSMHSAGTTVGMSSLSLDLWAVLASVGVWERIMGEMVWIWSLL